MWRATPTLTPRRQLPETPLTLLCQLRRISTTSECILLARHLYLVPTGILSFVSIQFTLSIFVDFFQNKIIDDKSKDGALRSILCSILPYMLRIEKKQ